MQRWEAFAADPADSSEVRVEKVTALIVAGACCACGIVWSAMYAAIFGVGLIAALPLAFVAIVGSALGVSHLTRDHRYAVYAQIVCIIGITTLISWSVGAVFDSGLVLLWGFVGPMTALLFFGRRQAIAWFVVFCAAVVVSVATSSQFAEHGREVSDRLQLFLVAMNLTMAGAVVLGFSSYFVSQAVAERARANALLLNVLPAEIAPALREGAGTIAEKYESASVLFADIVGSTPLFAELDATDAVDWLNEVFTMFDAITQRHGLEKIRTVGDNYMVAAGVPTRRADHAEAITRLALELCAGLEQLPPRHGRRLEFRIGISSGPMVGGVIGTHKFHYDVWGDTVNIASRMESHGEIGRIQITDATRDLLGDGFECEPRALLDVKGRGQITTWFVTGYRDALDTAVTAP